MELAKRLDIRPGVTAVIGGGGKTTLLRTLGEELQEKGRVLLCTTTRIFPFPDLPNALTARELDELAPRVRLLCAGTPFGETGKLTAPAIPMAELTARFDYVLVEADGSAQRPFKAHAAHEPVIPAEAENTVCVVGASGFGRTVEQAAHRPERYASLAGIGLQDAVTPAAEAAVLRAERLQQRVYVNQAETPAAQSAARALAAELDCPVLAGSLWRREYFVCS